MSNQCNQCGSYAINNHHHGRDGSDPDLCDVCYWHTRHDQLEAELAALKAQEPIGWYTEDHLTDKSATTYDRAIAERWDEKGWPLWPLYAAPAQPQSDGVLMPVSDVEEYISLLIDEADAHLHGRHQPEIQAHMRAEIERVRALLGGEA